MAWVIGGFLFCPCHLPLTLWLGATVLAGTAAGAALGEHPVASGVIVSVLWGLATWRGVYLLRAARRRQQ